MRTLKENLLRNVGVGRTKLIEEWMSNHGYSLNTYAISKDFTIKMNDGKVDLYYDDYDELPEYIQFTRGTYIYIIAKTIIKSFRGLPSHVGRINIELTRQQRYLPKLIVQSDGYVALKSKNLKNIELLDIRCKSLTWMTDAPLLNIRCKDIYRLHVEESVIGKKIEEIVKDIPHMGSESYPTESYYTTEEQEQKIQKLLGDVKLNDICKIYYSYHANNILTQSHERTKHWYKMNLIR